MIKDNIKKYRKKNKLSQAELGTMLGLTQGAISQWENGGASPNVETIKAMADIFGITFGELTGDDVHVAYQEKSQSNPTCDFLTDQIMAKARTMTEEELLQLLRIMDAVKK